MMFFPEMSFLQSGLSGKGDLRNVACLLITHKHLWGSQRIMWKRKYIAVVLGESASLMPVSGKTTVTQITEVCRRASLNTSNR